MGGRKIKELIPPAPTDAGFGGIDRVEILQDFFTGNGNGANEGGSGVEGEDYLPGATIFVGPGNPQLAGGAFNPGRPRTNAGEIWWTWLVLRLGQWADG